MKCKRCDSRLLKDEEGLFCLLCGYRPNRYELENFIAEETVRVMVELVNRFGKTIPLISDKSRRINASYSHLGRPRLLPQRFCKECGDPIYPRPYRVKEGGGNYCRRCFNKLYKPPLRVKGGNYTKRATLVI